MEGQSRVSTASTGIALLNLEAVDHDQTTPRVASAKLAPDSSQHSLLDSPQSLGKTACVRVIDTSELVAFIVSVVALAFAITTVSNGLVAWYLREKYQLVVVGFLLSIMNLCMMTILPTLFLRCEALFGQSTMQNYEAIMRNMPLASKAGRRWRAVLTLSIALPVGLSVVYKLFKNGHAMISIGPADNRYNGNFGLFAPPGLLPLGYDTGTILMYNITQPFLMASTNQTAPRSGSTIYLLDPNDEPALPSTLPYAYGFNTLLLNHTATALLDTPPSTWITQVQSTLGSGEYWDISASVLATIASRDSSIDSHRNESMSSPFWSHFDVTYNGPIQYQNFYSGWQLGMLTNTRNTTADKAWCLISLQPGNDEYNFTTWAQMWDLSRQYCCGRWRITPGDMRLIAGTCDPEDIPSNVPETQQPELVLTRTGVVMALTGTFMPALNEFLARFQGQWSNSTWNMPTTATVVASMYWSRMAAISGPGSPHWRGNNSFAASLRPPVASNVTDGLLYDRPANISSTRPAFEKSSILYAALALQPFITVLAVLVSIFLSHVPIGRGFGTVAILAGVEQDSHGLLEGAGYSGELDCPVHLGISIEESSEGDARVAYRLVNRRPPKPEKVSLARKYA